MTDGRPLAAGDMDTLRVALAGHPFCVDLDAAHIDALAEIAGEVTFADGTFILRHGHPADGLHLIISGDLALEIADPGREPHLIASLHGGDVLGWSWLFPPRRWAFDARSIGPVTLLKLDAARLLELIDADARFGRDLALRIGLIVVERLQATRAQVVDIRHHDHT
ncbi:MAG: cyclic nucleotide-binding domain-containing protein [Nitriliruptoraceae bacterium]